MTSQHRWWHTLVQRPMLAHALAWVLAVCAGVLASEGWRQVEDAQHRGHFQSVVQREAIRLESDTQRGAAMGMATMLGLNEPLLKEVALGRRPRDEAAVLSRMRVARTLAQADGVYVLNAQGVVVAHETLDPRITGADFSFRPFWSLGMHGLSTAYPGVGTASGKRGVYVTAPLYAGSAPGPDTIGVVVIKLSLDMVVEHLKSAGEKTLLLSPQGLVFASTQVEWDFKLSAHLTGTEWRHLRGLRQFGDRFQWDQLPERLPFDVSQREIVFQGERYLPARAPLQWQDPEGGWTVLGLTPVDRALPAWRRWLLGGVVALLAFALQAAVLRVLRDWEVRRAALAQTEQASLELAAAAELKARQSAMALQLQQAPDLSTLASVFFQQLGTLFPVHQGSLYFWVDEAGTGPALRLAGTYATSGAPEVIALGDSLVGQCALDLQSRVLDSVPEGFWHVSSATGDAPPRALVLLPITKQNELLGVVEMASLQQGVAAQLPDLQAFMPVLGMTLEVLLTQRRSQQWLAAAEARAAEQQTQQAYSQGMETWFHQVLDAAPDALLVVDEQGRVVWSNQRAHALLGQSGGALLGLPLDNWLPAEVWADFVDRPPNDRATVETLGVQAVCQDGSRLTLNVSITPLAATAYRPAGACVALRRAPESSPTVGETP